MRGKNGGSRKGDSGSGCGRDSGKSRLAGLLFISLLSSLVLLVADRLGYNVAQELEVVDTRNGTGYRACQRQTLRCVVVEDELTNVFVLDVSPGLLLGLDDILSLFDQILQEQLGSGGDGKGGVV